jgi:heat shock protein HslJ
VRLSFRTAFIALLLINPFSAMASDLTSESLDGSAWVLKALPPGDLLDEVSITLAFEDGQLAGTDGCNRFRGAYSFEDDGIRIGLLAGTMIACPEPIMQQASRFTDALGRARGVRLEDGDLLLVDEDGELLARFGARSQDLASTQWTVTGYNNGRKGVVSTANEASLTLEFDDAGDLTGSAGCNRYHSSYSADGRAISIGKPASTRKLCPEYIMTQEKLFLQALESSTAYHIDGDRLELRDDKGSLQVSARYSR